MTETLPQRKLAAILHADVVGYSRLMGKDEGGTLAALRQLRRELLEPIIIEYRGEVIKRMGDGWLVEFGSVVDAVNCAIKVQQGLNDQDTIMLRIGIHIGDIVHEDEDIFGDGVNIAARLQEIAEPGSILVSEDVRRQIGGKLGCELVKLGPRTLKNIAEPVLVYAIGQKQSKQSISKNNDVRPARQSKPSIAVLPFDNMSNDPEQEYFSDGITEDIITALSKYRSFFVIARNATFGYKGQSPDIKRLAREIGADYVVEGSVRKAGSRLRITAQLIDAETGNHVWAEHYDRELEDIFALQDEITTTIVARIEPEVGIVERHRAADKPRHNLQAWDCYHLGQAHFFKFTATDNLEAQRLFRQSFEIAPTFGDPYAWWAYAVVLSMVYFDTDPDTAILDEALRAVQKAVEIDDQNAVFYLLLGRVHLARCQYDTALAELERALELTPTLAAAYCGLADSLTYEGQIEAAIPLFEKSILLSPNDPQRWAFYSYGALAHIFDGDYARAVEWTQKAILIPNCQYWARAHKVVALGHLGRSDEASTAVKELLEQRPDFTCAFAQKKLFYIKKPEQLEIYLDGLRKAGVQEG